MQRIKRTSQIVFLIVVALAACEFLFVRGMFTWLIAAASVAVMGLVNVALTLMDREWLSAAHFALTTAVVCGSYFVLAS